MFILCDSLLDEIFLAGQKVPSGLYREIESHREVRLDQDEVLPASLDGRVAAYVCVRHIAGRHTPTETARRSKHE